MRRFCSFWSVVVLLIIPTVLFAHGPSRLKITEEISVAAPPQKVWDMIKNFCDIVNWHTQVAKCEGEGGNAPGAKRVLTLKAEGNPTIDEELLNYDAEKMTYKYKISKVDVKVLPVTTYSSFLTVKPNDSGGTVVSWSGGFYRGYTKNNPPPELNDEAAVKAVTTIYKAGLENLKKLAEQ